MDRRIRDLDQVKEIIRLESPIEMVIASYGIKVLPAGAEMKAVCPFHPDNDPSLGISVTKQIFLCRGCHEAGDVFRFVQLMENSSFFAALRKLAQLASIDLSQYEDDPTPEEAEQQKLIGINNLIQDRFVKTDAKLFIRWFDGRKFDPSVLMEYGVGYMAKVPVIEADREVKESLQLARAGKPYVGKWVNRIIVPLRDEHGAVMAFRTRSIDGSGAKVIGPEETHPLPVPVLYGLYEARKAIRSAGHVILVEGEPDVWQMRAHGYHNVVGLLGNHFNKEQAEALVELGVRRVILLPDGDDGGRKFALRASKFRYPGLDIKLGILKSGDPDETLLRDPSEVIDALSEARHVLEFAINHVLSSYEDLTQITTRIDVLHEMREVLKDVPEIERKLAYDHLSSVLGLAATDIADYFRAVTTQDRLHNTQAEKIAIARGLRDERFLGDLLLGVRIDDMYLNRHRRIYQAMGDMFRQSQVVTVDTVSIFLDNVRWPGDAAYVRGLVDTDVSGAEFVLADIRDKAVRRTIQKTATEMANRIGDTTQESKILLEGFSSQLAAVVVGSGDQLQSSADLAKQQILLMHEQIKHPNRIVGLDWGPDWPILNYTLHGFQQGRYLVLAAPSGIGKTAIAVSWLKRFAVDLGEPCLYLTFETGAEALNLRLLASVSGVESEKIITGFLTEIEVELVQEAAQVIAAAPIVITGRGQTIEEAQSIIRHDVIRRGTAVVFGDYLQLMGVSDSRGMSRHLEIGKVSRGFLEIGQELGTRMVALAQINREGAKRGRSTGLDLGDSFVPFQDSDIFYVVDEKGDDEIEEDGIEYGNRSGLIDKNRHGKGKVRSNLMMDLTTMRIKEVHPKSDQR